MAGIKANNYKNDPLVSSELVKFLAINTGFASIEKLANDSDATCKTATNQSDEMKKLYDLLIKRSIMQKGFVNVHTMNQNFRPEVKQSSRTIPTGTNARPSHAPTGEPILYMVAPNDNLVLTCDTLSTFQSKVKVTAYKLPTAATYAAATQVAPTPTTTIIGDGISCFGDNTTQMTAASVITRFEERFTSNEESINNRNMMLNQILKQLQNNGVSPPATQQSDSPSTNGVSSPDLDKSKGISGTGHASTDPPKGDYILWMTLT
eukprot:scaffold51435_cov63-Attheya_sp.AAC.8